VNQEGGGDGIVDTISANISVRWWRSNTRETVTLTLRLIFRIFLRNLAFDRLIVPTEGLSILAAILGYLLGSVPTAYIVVRLTSHVDIRRAGSGNVGTLNSYLVTRSKLAALAVLVGDVLKGSGAVWLSRLVCGPEFFYGAIAGCAAVLGHSFPVWLKGKGGRGLATAAGVVLVLGWLWVVIWLSIWGIGFAVWRNVNVANAAASLAVLLGAGIFLPEHLVQMSIPHNVAAGGFRYAAAALMALVLIRLIEPVKEFITRKS
jgi:glycerol-3-phosphate acyltransferase PlsY